MHERNRSLAGGELLPHSIEFSFPALAGAMAATGALQKDGVEVVVPIGHGLAERNIYFLAAARRPPGI